MAYETIIYEKENGVATMTLNRPQALNAFVPQMNKDIIDALKAGERTRSEGANTGPEGITGRFVAGKI